MRMTPQEFAQAFPDHPLAKAVIKKTPPAQKQKAIARVPAGPSYLEALFDQQLKALKAPAAQREHRFDPQRNWRMDFAWPELNLAVEIEGGVWGMGRHNRPKGFIADTEKYNRAAQLGWTVFRFTGKSIKSGEAATQIVDTLNKALGDILHYNAETHTTNAQRTRLK